MEYLDPTTYVGSDSSEESDDNSESPFFCEVLDKYLVKIDPQSPPKYAYTDPAAKSYFDENGYVIFKKLASDDEVSHAITLFWDHLENESKKKIQRDNALTWTDQNGWPTFVGGLFIGLGIHHSEFMWYCRGLPKIAAAFATLWQDDDLITSFDCCGAFRPPEGNLNWMTQRGWFHADQNGAYKKGRCAIQGLLNLLPSTELDGGLVVMPKTPTLFEKLFSSKEIPDWAPKRPGNDYVSFTRVDCAELWRDHEAIKLCLDAGDFVMWDSRTVHCNHPCTPKGVNTPEKAPLRRLVAYICMGPLSLCPKENRETLIRQRAIAYQRAAGTTHWPHEIHLSSFGHKSETFARAPRLNEHQRRLVVGKESKLDLETPIKLEKEDIFVFV